MSERYRNQESRSRAEAQIGRWGTLTIKPGFYTYVGSAFGPGGVKARVLRHYRTDKFRHWHIDYLREFVTPVCTWYSYDRRKLEHRWAQAFAGMTAASPVKRFGCSDCNCSSHLFVTADMPEIEDFRAIVGGELEAISYRDTM